LQSILLTSFATWKAEQLSNSSDDLLATLLERNLFGQEVHLLRQIPVDFELAPRRVLLAIDQIQPQAVICCGMAETRSRLSIEIKGKSETREIYTQLDVDHLVQDRLLTEISHDAGKFVCNHLYYSVLTHLQSHQPHTHGLFIHVPILNPKNLDPIVQDFTAILNLISAITLKQEL
jgi:pyroglutamyl-peptidase